MEKWTLAAGGGRSLLVRPCVGGAHLQLAVVSTRGNIIEDATIPAESAPALIELIRRAAHVAERDLMAAMTRARERAAARRVERRPVRAPRSGREFVAFDRGAT